MLILATVGCADGGSSAEMGRTAETPADTSFPVVPLEHAAPAPEPDPGVGGDGCSPPVEREWFDPDPDQQRFLESGQQWGTAEYAIVQSLGNPARRTVDTTRNRHTDSLDQIVRLDYAGLTFHIYRVMEVQKDILIGVAADGQGHRFAFGLGIGTPWLDVAACLGDPGTVDVIHADSTLYLYNVGELDEEVLFWVTRDTVRRIEWNYYID